MLSVIEYVFEKIVDQAGGVGVSRVQMGIYASDSEASKAVVFGGVTPCLLIIQ